MGGRGGAGPPHPAQPPPPGGPPPARQKHPGAAALPAPRGAPAPPPAIAPFRAAAAHERRPLCGTQATVAMDATVELGIARHGGGEVGDRGAAGKGPGPLEAVPALAATGAAQDEDEAAAHDAATMPSRTATNPI